MWTIFKVFIEFVTTLLPCFGFLAMRYVGSWLLDQGIKPAPPALENKVLTTGPPGMSISVLIFNEETFVHASYMSITILRFGDTKMNLKGLQSKEYMVIMVK